MHFWLFKAMARAVLLPPTGLLILSLLGAVLLRLRYPRCGWSCLTAGLGLLWLLATPLIADALTVLAQGYPAFNPAGGTNAQAIVILGGEGQRMPAPEYGGEPAAELELLERLNYGAWLSRQTHLPILVTSERSNALTMAVSLSRDFRTPPRWVDLHAHDTYENARNSAQLLRADHVTSVLLVTSATHMLRSMREFTATGLSVTAAPVQIRLFSQELPEPYPLHRFLPSAEGLQRANRAVYELLGEPVRELLAFLHLRRQQPQLAGAAGA